MPRRLNPDEQRLWQQVAGTARPLAGREQVELPPASSPAVVSRASSSLPSASKKPGATLDSTWDRRLVRGRIALDAVVDLHGHSLASAHAPLEAAIALAHASGKRLLLVVTGKPRSEGERGGRGAIRAQVGDWLATSRHAGAIAAVRPAHQRHGGAGAFYLILRRPRQRG
ncbi:MAG: Smr/MutS family protein [Sphingosinicella sp.]